MQYIVILLDDTSVSYCHYDNEKTNSRLMPLDTLKAGILYAMKENLNIQFVYPNYPIPKEYEQAINSIDHTNIKPAAYANGADIIVFNGIEELKAITALRNGVSSLLRTDRLMLFKHIEDICPILYNAERLNIVITDMEAFTENDFTAYSKVLNILAKEVENIYASGKTVQLNLLTDRMMLGKMNNCGAGDSCITLAPDGKFYVCPAFYLMENGFAVGDIEHGIEIKNRQLYRLNHAPLCRNCDAYQCKRCIWLNCKTTLEVNTPSHEQCVAAHLERNASRMLLLAIRKHGTFLPKVDNIKEINYLDPFDIRKEW